MELWLLGGPLVGLFVMCLVIIVIDIVYTQRRAEGIFGATRLKLAFGWFLFWFIGCGMVVVGNGSSARAGMIMVGGVLSLVLAVVCLVWAVLPSKFVEPIS